VTAAWPEETVEIRAEAPDGAVGRACLGAYFRELDERFEGGCHFDAGDRGILDEMSPPSGFFLVAYAGEEPVGCAGLKRLDELTGELKRMWVAPSARGRGVAVTLLRSAESRALEIGCRRLYLDTNRVLREAQAFYRREGFAEIARYNDNPYAHYWFEKRL
jgi:GNAT superfamily N-acetyltransferase